MTIFALRPWIHICRPMRLALLSIVLLSQCLFTALAQDAHHPAASHAPVVSEEAGPSASSLTTESAPQSTEEAPSMAGRPLNQVYQRNKAEQRRFTSGDYLGQVFLLTAAVIILILVMAKMILPRHAPGGKDSLLPFSPTSNNPMAGPPPGGTSSSPSPVSSTEPWLSRLFGGLKPMAEAETSLRPQILFRSRLGPTKDIHVIQVAGKRLVVGSTNHQMTLLTELDSSMDTSLVTPDPDADLYKQYLPSEDSSSAQPPLAGDEEIVILDDYEDTYDTNA